MLWADCQGKPHSYRVAQKGLGAEMARAMHEEGANVMVTDVLEDEGIKLADAHENMEFVQHDVTDEAQWQAAIDATLSALAGLTCWSSIMPALCTTRRRSKKHRWRNGGMLWRLIWTEFSRCKIRRAQ